MKFLKTVSPSNLRSAIRLAVYVAGLLLTVFNAVPAATLPAVAVGLEPALRWIIRNADTAEAAVDPNPDVPAA